MHLSNNIRIIRKLYQDTQAEFAKRFTGVTLGMQKSYETGGTTPSLLYLQELSELGGVTIDQLQKAQLSKSDIKLPGKDNKVNSSQYFTADQLFAMFLEVSSKQTSILQSIESKMAQENTLKEVAKDVTRVFGGLEALAAGQTPVMREILSGLEELKVQRKERVKG